MGDMEPVTTPAHELLIMVQGVAPTAAMAEEVCMTGTRQLFYARLPDVKGTAGGVAFPLDEVLHASARRIAGRSTTRSPSMTRWSCFPSTWSTWRMRSRQSLPSAKGSRQDHPEQECRGRQDHVRRDLHRPHGLRPRPAQPRSDPRIRRVASSRSRRAGFRISSNTIPACAIKFTILRVRPSGSPGDPDIFGSQQYAPLLDVAVDLSA